MRFGKSLASFERQRFWKHSAAAFVLVIATGIEIYRSLSFVYYPSAEMFAYQRYSEVLSGERSAEKEAFLMQEEERLREVSSSGNPETVNEAGLMRAKNQYEMLADDMPFVLAALMVLIGSLALGRALKRVVRLAFRTGAGLAALALLSQASGVLGIHLGVNLFNAAVLGLFGIPGFGLLMMLSWALRT